MQSVGGGRVKTPNINTKSSLYVLVWMYNEFLFMLQKLLDIAKPWLVKVRAL